MHGQRVVPSEIVLGIGLEVVSLADNWALKVDVMLKSPIKVDLQPG